MSHKFLFFLFLSGILLGPLTTLGQSGSDTFRIVEILDARKFEFRRIDSVTTLRILVGNVRLRQGNTIFTCDSCIVNDFTNVFEAFGRVHIKDADTADVYSDYLRYLTDKRIAYLNRNVRLTDGKGTLTTNSLEYDLNTKIGIYRNGGRVINGTTVLTSDEGYYYADLKDVYFKRNVRLKDPAYNITTDSLLYNTESETARFISQTYIVDSSGRTITAREGYYNRKTGMAEFGRGARITDGALTIIGNRITSDDATGMSVVEGDAIINDSVQGTTIIAGIIIRNNKTESFLATRKPLMIVKQDEDSIYIAADTLFSARLTELYGEDSVLVDTVKGTRVLNPNIKDSTNRYFEAFRNVRIFSDSLQAISDSLFYSFRDSTFRLYQNPVIWANNSQIIGDTILLFTKNRKPERMRVFENSLLVNRVQDEIFNQVQSTRFEALFTDGRMDSARARGNAQYIFYVQDDDSAFVGVNESTSDLLDVYFRNDSLYKIVPRSMVKGTFWPMRYKTPQEMRLPLFIWLEARRPKTKFELFE